MSDKMSKDALDSILHRTGIRVTLGNILPTHGEYRIITAEHSRDNFGIATPCTVILSGPLPQALDRLSIRKDILRTVATKCIYQPCNA